MLVFRVSNDEKSEIRNFSFFSFCLFSCYWERNGGLLFFGIELFHLFVDFLIFGLAVLLRKCYLM